MATSTLIDVSRPLHSAIPTWPGDRPFELTREAAATLSLSVIAGSCHAGTHLEAPLHVDPGGATVDRIPLERLCGSVEVVQVPAGAAAIGQSSLPGWKPGCTRVLFRTDSHPLDQPIGEGFPGIEEGFAAWLEQLGVTVIGVDTPSVDRFEAEHLTAHHELAAAGITWIEGLWLAAAAPGRYRMLALPMALVGADAAPIRVVLERLP